MTVGSNGRQNLPTVNEVLKPPGGGYSWEGLNLSWGCVRQLASHTQDTQQMDLEHLSDSGKASGMSSTCESPFSALDVISTRCCQVSRTRACVMACVDAILDLRWQRLSVGMCGCRRRKPAEVPGECLPDRSYDRRYGAAGTDCAYGATRRTRRLGR